MSIPCGAVPAYPPLLACGRRSRDRTPAGRAAIATGWESNWG